MAQTKPYFNHRQLVILLHLYIRGADTDYATVVADLDLKKPAVTNAIGQLETDKLIKRVRKFGRRHSTWLSITPEGRKFVQKLCGLA